MSETSVKYRTFWLSPVDGQTPASVEQACQWAKAQTPEGMQPGILWPAVFGPWWQKYCNTTLAKALCPANGAELAAIRAQVESRGVAFGCWVVPRTLSVYEAQQHREAALAAGFIALDLEPYGNWDAQGNWHGFLEPPFDRSPDEYLAALWGDDDPGFKVALSVVPQPSGIEPLGDAFVLWLRGVNELRPQCYWSDGSQLHPDIAIPYLHQQLADIGDAVDPMLPIIPIIPSPGVDLAALEYSASYDGDLDIWRLLPVEVAEPEPEPEIEWMQRALAAEAERDRYRQAIENIRVMTEVLGS